jgi:Polyketide cyclase / dehydrase and lipid transport
VANDFTVSINIDVPADTAWKVAGDPIGIADWFAPAATCEPKPSGRKVTMTSGAVLLEDLVDRDDAARRYSYVVTEGIPGLTSHKATIGVDETPTGSRVSWRQTATSDDPDYDIESRLRVPLTNALEALKFRLESA